MDRENAPPPSRKLCHLPEELIEEILSRLAVKSLLRFRCVSKSWRCLMSSERFIRTQLEKSSNDPTAAHWQVLFNCGCGSKFSTSGLQQCSVRSFLDDPDVDPSPIDDPTNHHLTTGGYLVGNCDGLLCILKKPGSFFLWNLATRISMELPKIDLKITKSGFGHDDESGAYKVFVVGSTYAEEKREWIGKHYSSKTNSWKTVKLGCHAVGVGAEYISPNKWFRHMVWTARRVKENTGYEPAFMTRTIVNKRMKEFLQIMNNFVYVESLVSPVPQNL
ncbi:F-box/kelch-repeat protein At3g23880-like [Salvia miltiorrhiza]|uniref:F-box/kelch-repeat protein At3g23880-like n=1 Tax=Salvia miltiorrhiza TaxID=226208 RepID=UPI0025ABEE7E|nr:F-box/kelch-repeat protein At3g23880-like [Salvia miltiorrhiza]